MTEAETQDDSQSEIESATEELDEARKELVETLKYILQHAKPGRETKGQSTQFEKPGGYNEAVEDFEKLKPSDIKNLEKNKKIGTLTDGRIINIRKESSDERPTLEIYNPIIKIRYGNRNKE